MEKLIYGLNDKRKVSVNDETNIMLNYGKKVFH